MAEFIRQRRRWGFLMNLDFYYAYVSVCLPYMEKVLPAMGFGNIFREMVATMHRGATTFPSSDHAGPVRQGDPIVMLLYIVQLQPLLLQLEDALPGVSLPVFGERVEAYVDNVMAVGEDEGDLDIIDAICRQFEAVSGAILNSSHKTAILSSGGWAGRKE
jgi:hypothetical protein